MKKNSHPSLVASISAAIVFADQFFRNKKKKIFDKDQSKFAFLSQTQKSVERSGNARQNFDVSLFSPQVVDMGAVVDVITALEKTPITKEVLEVTIDLNHTK